MAFMIKATDEDSTELDIMVCDTQEEATKNIEDLNTNDTWPATTGGYYYVEIN